MKKINFAQLIILFYLFLLSVLAEPKKGLNQKLLIRYDEIYVYMTQDIATANIHFRNFHIN